MTYSKAFAWLSVPKLAGYGISYRKEIVNWLTSSDNFCPLICIYYNVYDCHMPAIFKPNNDHKFMD